MNRVVVDNRVRVHGRIAAAVRERLEAEFSHANPKRAALEGMGYSARGEPAVIRTWRDEDESLTFPRGGLARVREALRSAGVEYRVEDRRQPGVVSGGGIPDLLQQPWPFQDEAARAMLARENCLLRAPTGGGKTSVLISLIARLKVPSLVVVWNAGLFDQWRERLVKELGIDAGDVGVISGGKWRLKPVTVAMQQSLAARELQPELLEYFGLVGCDEVQRAASDTLYAVVDQFPARYRFGISADERRKDGKEFITRDLFGEVAYEVDREELVRQGFILDVEVRVVPTEFGAPWYGHPAEGLELDDDRLLREMTADAPRNAMLAGLALSEVQRGEQVLVMSRRVEHCKALCRELVSRGARCGFLLGGAENKLEYRRSVAGLRDGTIQVGVGTYQALGTGIDIPRVGAGVCATPIASNRQFFNQVRGRLCRISPGKASPRLYYAWDHRVVSGHLDNLRKWNSTVVALVNGALVKVDSRRAVRGVCAALQGVAGGIG